MELKEKIRKFIEDNLVVFEDEADFSDSDNIFEMGFVNSLFAMKLVSYIEQEFSIEVDNEDLEISNFSSVERIVGYIENKQEG
ncbi:MAG: acyl carrier protein [Candidatus Aminicenantes bacterium]|nr:acyl carrier protein [Candidatus Aminicenantes bacterium]NIQ65195.1 acyl carrier protein [Candidatus Aminicenantes bacterium]NIT21198.1 acyl carrier protein [Candidatus Aminicenantes bacterium]